MTSLEFWFFSYAVFLTFSILTLVCCSLKKPTRQLSLVLFTVGSGDKFLSFYVINMPVSFFLVLVQKSNPGFPTEGDTDRASCPLSMKWM